MYSTYMILYYYSTTAELYDCMHNSYVHIIYHANSHFAVTVQSLPLLLRRDDVVRKLRLRDEDGGAAQGFLSSACADTDALSVVTLAPGLLLPLKSPQSKSSRGCVSWNVHFGCCTFAMRSPFAARAQDAVPVPVHCQFCVGMMSQFTKHGASPLQVSTKLPSHGTVAVPEVCFPSAAVNVPLTATGAHPVHIRPTRPP